MLVLVLNPLVPEKDDALATARLMNGLCQRFLLYLLLN